MKKIIYNLINKLGYNIYNKKKKDLDLKTRLQKFLVNKNYDLLYHSSYYVFLLENKFPDLTISDSSTGLQICFQNLIFNIDSLDEFIILNEIFINKDYNFLSPEKCLIIDIGANVGMASIFFSQLEHVDKIYAFEPVKDTYDIALKNLKSNNIQKIMRFNNYGLGSSDREEKFIFNRKAKGNFGMRTKPNGKNIDTQEERRVLIKKASVQIDLILKENPRHTVVIKMDCEGAEYEIMEDLHEAFLLSKIDVFILEWHDYGARALEQWLTLNGFTVFSRDLGKVSGIISAVRNNT